VLHTDTLAGRPAGEEPEASLDQVDRAYLLWKQAERPMTALTNFGTKPGIRYLPKVPTRC
jgi:hypothetical protein